MADEKKRKGPARYNTKNRPAPKTTDPFGMFWQEREKGQKPTMEEEEIILALYMLSNNMSDVSRSTGWSLQTITRVLRQHVKAGRLEEVREARRREYAELAWDGIYLAMQTIIDGLRDGYIKDGDVIDENGNPVFMASRVRPGEAASVLQRLHHSVRLHEDKPTDIIRDWVKNLSHEELREEIKRRYEALMNDDEPRSLQ